MNEIKVNGSTNILGIDVPCIEGGFGEGQKVVLAKTIAELHNTEVKYVNRLINDNIDEFEFGIDIIDLKMNGGIFNNILKELKFSNRDISISKNIYLLSEKGYNKFYTLIRHKNEKIYNSIMENIFNSSGNKIAYVEKKAVRFFNMLDDALKSFDIEGEREFNTINNYRIDYYIQSLNLAIEYDENEHRNYTYEKHELREEIIQKELGCRFIRISDKNSLGYNLGYVTKEVLKCLLSWTSEQEFIKEFVS